MNDPTVRDLASLETVIERGMTTFIEVGRALWEIKEGDLYIGAGYADFDAYCRERWGWKQARAYQLMSAAKVVAALSTTVEMPASERQARELARAKDPEVIREVWEQAREEHGEQPTAAEIRQVVERRLTPSEPEPGIEWSMESGVDADGEVTIDIPTMTVTSHSPNVRIVPSPPKPDPVAEYLAQNEDDEDRRLKLRIYFYRELKHATELMCLKPDAIAEAADQDLRQDINHYFTQFRRWMDAVESALPKGLRVVG